MPTSGRRQHRRDWYRERRRDYAATIVDVGDDTAGSDFRAGGPPLHLDGDRRGPGAGGVTAGTVESINGTTITVESVDGSTVVVATTADTAITVTKAISLADLAVGDTVSVLGRPTVRP